MLLTNRDLREREKKITTGEKNLVIWVNVLDVQKVMFIFI